VPSVLQGMAVVYMAIVWDGGYCCLRMLCHVLLCSNEMHLLFSEPGSLFYHIQANDFNLGTQSHIVFATDAIYILCCKPQERVSGTPTIQNPKPKTRRLHKELY